MQHLLYPLLFKASVRMHVLDEVGLFLGHVLVTTLPTAYALGALCLNPSCFARWHRAFLEDQGNNRKALSTSLHRVGIAPFHFPFGSAEMCCHSGNPSKNETLSSQPVTTGASTCIG